MAMVSSAWQSARWVLRTDVRVGAFVRAGTEYDLLTKAKSGLQVRWCSPSSCTIAPEPRRGQCAGRISDVDWKAAKRR
jgi:hypothetical protein